MRKGIEVHHNLLKLHKEFGVSKIELPSLEISDNEANTPAKTGHCGISVEHKEHPWFIPWMCVGKGVDGSLRSVQ